MPSPLFHPDIMDHEMVVSSTGPSGGVTEHEPRGEDRQEALRFALDQLSLITMDEVDCLDGTAPGENCNGGGGYVDLQILDHTNGSRESPDSCSPSPEYYGSGGGGGYHMAGPHSSILGEQSSVLRKRSVNMTECVPVPTSEHVAEIVGRQGCKIKALRAKTNTYIKTPVRGEEPVFIVTGRREDVEMAKREIISAAEHFSMIRASRCKAGANGPGSSGSLPGPPNLPGQTTIQVRVPYRVVGLVVGPKGATIKRIQQQTHTYIVTPSREKDPVFEVTGMPENVDRAREEIETHITLRTGAFVDLQTENDFHNNGTDVSLEGLGSLGLSGALWSRATHSAPPSQKHHSTRKMSSESFSATRRVADGSGSPTSPFSTSSAGGSFSFTGDSTPSLPATSEDLGFEFGAANIWAPFLNGAKQQPAPLQTVRRNSSGLSGGAITPRLSPDPDHPLARRAQSDPLSALSWLQTAAGGSSSAGSSTGYSSCSASSLPGGSPTDSEGGGSGGGIASTMLGRLKAGGLAGMVSRDCFVCCESEVTAALVPCGHNLFCMDCAGQICQSQDPECPVCHTPATQCIRIFS
ncbi:RNA-binding protein MEX3B-like [Carassius auratus]|uniref:RNA-binding protein MEX3B-like n=1 Tax=Carassius auratus TaxID=7957 RepID=A0A6P6NL70_CARAU|nr:RNA-binding protein MEX3B-like [Carassius auratus]XP_026109732.1 RNA-binding protein MEX3B-like [Carassius auratus]XP_026133219.1 RNA-binding protein MEX3B-like [Carassius auratus]XP_026133228.1 RNA-binding protein MEX3B-like [Carassius auratus]XP_052391245.1 RNA-binding protein MEX3B-like [Carassius gibelio]XP_052391251.1 RNA-binding protein MEX3B-like [Carassius gibelio]